MLSQMDCDLGDINVWQNAMDGFGAEWFAYLKISNCLFYIYAFHYPFCPRIKCPDALPRNVGATLGLELRVLAVRFIH